MRRIAGEVGGVGLRSAEDRTCTSARWRQAAGLRPGPLLGALGASLMHMDASPCPRCQRPVAHNGLSQGELTVAAAKRELVQKRKCPHCGLPLSRRDEPNARWSGGWAA